MSLHLKRDESVGRGVRRIVRRLLDDARDELGRPGADRDAVVHDVRRHCKKVRAVLRLVRDELGDKLYCRENARFRDAGRPLTEVRDAKALLETWDKLTAHFADRMAEGGFAAVRQALLDNHRAARRRVLKQGTVPALVAAAVKAARGRLRDWRFRHSGWAAVRGGLKRVYKNGRQALAVAEAEPTVENLHEWRKQAKYLWHQLEILAPARPDVLHELADQMHELSRLLGDDHDLHMLRQKLAADPVAFGGRIGRTLIAVIDRRRGDLEREALRLGRCVYRDEPKDFTDQIKRHWKAWRSGAARPAERPPDSNRRSVISRPNG